MAIDTSEQIEQLVHVLESMDNAAEILRSLDDPRINAYCLADFEGSTRGWLGRFVRDVLEERLQALKADDEEETSE